MNYVKRKYGGTVVNGAGQALGEGHFTLLTASHYINYVELNINYARELQRRRLLK